MTLTQDEKSLIIHALSAVVPATRDRSARTLVCKLIEAWGIQPDLQYVIHIQQTAFEEIHEPEV